MQRGFVELIRPFQIRGWARDTDEPDFPINIQAFVDDETIAVGVADLFRVDLAIPGEDEGLHGFVLNLSDRISEDEQQRLVVTGTGSNGIEFPLITLPNARQAETAPAEPPQPSVIQEVIEKESPLFGLFPDSSEPAHHPVFVLGSARSGTSAIAQGLLRATRYSGQEEGHLLDLINPIFEALQTHYDNRGEEWLHRATMIAEVPQQYFRDGFQQLMVVLARRLFPSGFWLDKTPGPAMILAAPLLKKVWPEARFIFMKRRAIENIQSRIRKFPQGAFETHCRDWAASMTAWQSIRSQLSGHSIEIDQFSLASEPAMVANALSPFLMLQPQELKLLKSSLKTDQPERTSNNFAALDIDDLNWSTAERDVFTEICGAIMSDFGYSTTESYFLPGKEMEGILMSEPLP